MPADVVDLFFKLDKHRSDVVGSFSELDKHGWCWRCDWKFAVKAEEVCEFDYWMLALF